MDRRRPKDPRRGPSLGGFARPKGEASQEQDHHEAQHEREAPCKTLEERG